MVDRFSKFMLNEYNVNIDNIDINYLKENNIDSISTNKIRVFYKYIYPELEYCDFNKDYIEELKKAIYKTDYGNNKDQISFNLQNWSKQIRSFCLNTISSKIEIEDIKPPLQNIGQIIENYNERALNKKIENVKKLHKIIPRLDKSADNIIINKPLYCSDILVEELKDISVGLPLDSDNIIMSEIDRKNWYENEENEYKQIIKIIVQDLINEDIPKLDNYNINVINPNLIDNEEIMTITNTPRKITTLKKIQPKYTKYISENEIRKSRLDPKTIGIVKKTHGNDYRLLLNINGNRVWSGYYHPLVDEYYDCDLGCEYNNTQKTNEKILDSCILQKSRREKDNKFMPPTVIKNINKCKNIIKQQKSYSSRKRSRSPSRNNSYRSTYERSRTRSPPRINSYRSTYERSRTRSPPRNNSYRTRSPPRSLQRSPPRSPQRSRQRSPQRSRQRSPQRSRQRSPPRSPPRSPQSNRQRSSSYRSSYESYTTRSPKRRPFDRYR